MKRIRLALKILLISFPLMATDSFPQESNRNFMSKFKGLQQSLMEGKDLLQETFNKLNVDEEKQDLEKKGIQDRKMIDTLQTLKNPFIPQLPIIEGPTTEGQTQEESLMPNQAIQDAPQMMPTIEEIIRPPTLTISGLIWNTDRPQAIINDKVINQGEIVDGCEITQIGKEGIKFKFQNKVFTQESIMQFNKGAALWPENKPRY